MPHREVLLTESCYTNRQTTPDRTIVKDKFVLVSVLLGAICVPPSAHALSLRCGTALIQAGDSKLKVMRNCGDPMYRDIVSGALDSRVEEWIYQRSSRDFPYVLTIRGHKVIRIERLEE